MIRDILELQGVLEVLAEGVVEHMSPGRIRLRFRSRRGDVSFFRQIVSLIGRHPAVDAVDANPQTGGVLIRHSMSQADLDKLFRRLQEQRAELAGERPRLNPGFPRLPSGRDLMTMAFLGLSVIQLLRGRTFGSASEQLWHAAQAERLHIPGAQPVLLLLAVLQIARGRVLAPASSLMMYGLMSAFTNGQGGEAEGGGADAD